nr:TonB-dependent receptor [Kineobactrum salinum]
MFDYPLDSGASLSARADYTRKGKAYQDLQNLEVAAIEAYEVTNLRVAYSAEGASWELAGWMKNVFDEQYMLHNFAINPGVSTNPTPAAPRTAGATLTVWF